MYRYDGALGLPREEREAAFGAGLSTRHQQIKKVSGVGRGDLLRRLVWHSVLHLFHLRKKSGNFLGEAARQGSRLASGQPRQRCARQLRALAAVGRWLGYRPKRRHTRGRQRLGYHLPRLDDVRFSNRPFGVKHFQTIHQCGVDVAHGLVLLFGIGTWALVWGFLCQGVGQGGEAFLRRFLGSISKARFFVPTCAVTPTLRHASPLPGHTMTASSTTAR
jgi:hypothetical protein